MDLEPLKIDRSRSAGRRRSRRGARLAGWAVALAALAFLSWLFQEPLLGWLDRLRLPRVEVVRVVRTSPVAASAVSGTAANGYIVASVRAALSADTPGRIVEMNVTEGSVVKKGDVVARLYADEYRAALERAQADLEAARAAALRAEAERAVAAVALERSGSLAQAAEAGVAEAQAAHGLARIELERAQKLVDESVESVQRLDQARAELERSAAAREGAEANLAAARGAVEQSRSEVEVARAAALEAGARVASAAAARDGAKATLDKTEVRAPFDGIVVLKDAEVGEVVSPNSLGGNSRGSVATLVDFASLEVQVEVPETSLAAVEPGASAFIYLDAWPEERYTGRVQRIWPTANRQKATVEVRVGFDRTDERLRPEMGARVVFSPKGPALGEEGTADEIERILIPSRSVVKVGGRRGVFVLERDVARFRPLELGGERSGRVLVVGGLEGGERIVADPPHSLEDGDRVWLEEGS